MKGDKTPKRQKQSMAAPATEVKQKKRKAPLEGAPASAPAKAQIGKKARDSVPAVRVHSELEDAQEGKKKKKQKGEAQATDEAPRQQQQERRQQQQPQPIPQKNKKRKRKAGAQQQDDASLPPEERERRRRQRELRELALKLRVQGQNYNPKRARRQKEREQERGHKPRRAVQVIIVPIYWNKKQDEKERVLEAAEHAQQVLRDAGIKCDTDTTNEKTPGQKFRYWEERGVRLRIELGPKEATAGRCVLARCRNPGEVAQKDNLEVGDALLAAVHAVLGTAAPAQQHAKQGVAQRGSQPAEPEEQEKQQHEDEIEEEEGEESGAMHEQQPRKKAKKARQQQAQQAEAGAQQGPGGGSGQSAGQAKAAQQQGPAAAAAAQQRPQQLNMVAGKSGDDLEDDFAGLQAKQEEEQAGRGGGKKKKRKSQGKGGAGSLAPEDQEGLRVLLATPGAEKVSKAPKAVKF